MRILKKFILAKTKKKLQKCEIKLWTKLDKIKKKMKKPKKNAKT